MHLSWTKNRTIRLLVVFAIMVMVAIVMGSIVTLHLLRKQETDLWSRELDRLSLVMAEDTKRTMLSAYLVLDMITDRVREENIVDAAALRKTMGTPKTHQLMQERIQGLSPLDVATIVADNGDIINFTGSYPAPPLNLSERDYFQAHARDPALGEFVSNPVRDKDSGKWVFYLSRRLNGSNGQFIGLVLVGISVESLINFYEKIGQNLGEGASLNLYRGDFTRLARWPHLESAIGKKSGGGARSTLTAQKKNDVRFSDTTRLSDGTSAPRLVATRAVPNYPLMVTVAATEDLYLASWRQAKVLVLMLTATSLLALVAALFYLLRIMQQRESDMELNHQLRIAAEAASEAKSQFLSSMSHELRTPLNAILGYSQLFDIDPDLSADNRENAREIGRAGRHLLALINDMIDLSRIESGKLELALEPLVVKSITKDCFNLLTAKAQEAGVVLIDEGGDAQEATILVDPVRLRQIMINFLSNAIKYNRPQGSVRLSYSLRAGAVRIAVSDTGLGIPADRQSRIFTAFDRLGAERGAIEGTGIGLVITKRMVEAMGGTIGFESIEGQGSTFWVEFPLCTQAHASRTA